MDGIAQARRIPLAANAVAWLLQQPVVTSVILGAKSLAQIDDQLLAFDITLSPQELETLAKASALPVEYPGWALASNDAARTTLLQTDRLPAEH
jgi:aryl-alcohol dehydrogenase-like predicted oxidoreductase